MDQRRIPDSHGGGTDHAAALHRERPGGALERREQRRSHLRGGGERHLDLAANTGDSIVLRIGQLWDATGNFEPQIRLLSPANAQLGSSVGDLAAEIAVTAPSSGTYTVVVSDGNLGHSGDSTNNTGTYRLHLAKSPGTFVVPGGDEGGDLINGAIQEGTIDVGDLDLWSFTASAGDSIVVRVGEVTDSGNFEPQIRLYDPAGAQVGSSAGDLAAEIAVTAPSSGTYTVVVSDGNLAHSGDSLGNTGTYRLHLAKVPGPFVVGDEGGVRVPAGTYSGSIHAGDLDMWSFCADAGDPIAVHMGETSDNGNFEPLIRLYGPTGTLLRSNAGDLAADASVVAGSSGTYTVVVSDVNLAHSGDSLGNTGTYQLTISGNVGCSSTTTSSTTTTSTISTSTTTTSTTRLTTTTMSTTTSTTTTTHPTTTTTSTTSITSTSTTTSSMTSTSTTTTTQPSTTTTTATSTTHPPTSATTTTSTTTTTTLTEAISRCPPGATVCGGTVSQPFRQTPTGLVPRPRIDLLCQVDRTLFTGATKGGSCRAVAFRRQASPAALAGAAPTYTCTALGEGAPDCATAHSGDLRLTKRQRKKLGRDGSAVVRMNLNPLARKALQNAGSLDADVCGTIQLPGGITTQLECSLTLRAGSSTRTRPAESRPRAGRRS